MCNRKVIEVKGLRPHQWQKFRRMVPPKQLRHCVRNRAIIVWTLAKGNSQDSKVKLMGWNYAHEVENHGVEVRTICDNIWLQDDEVTHMGVTGIGGFFFRAKEMHLNGIIGVL